MTILKMALRNSMKIPLRKINACPARLTSFGQVGKKYRAGV